MYIYIYTHICFLWSAPLPNICIIFIYIYIQICMTKFSPSGMMDPAIPVPAEPEGFVENASDRWGRGFSWCWLGPERYYQTLAMAMWSNWVKTIFAMNMQWRNSILHFLWWRSLAFAKALTRSMVSLTKKRSNHLGLEASVLKTKKH